MLKTFSHYFTYLPQKRRYWLSYIIISLLLLSTALYYQFVREELPCVVCIQIRLWLSLLILLSLLGYVLRQSRWIKAANVMLLLPAIGLVERSYLLLGTERGFIFSDCGFNLGLPSWFAVEEALPWLYRIETSCGYTPELLFGITMAESLMALSVVFLLVSFSVALLGLKSKVTQD